MTTLDHETTTARWYRFIAEPAEVFPSALAYMETNAASYRQMAARARTKAAGARTPEVRLQLERGAFRLDARADAYEDAARVLADAVDAVMSEHAELDRTDWGAVAGAGWI